MKPTSPKIALTTAAFGLVLLVILAFILARPTDNESSARENHTALAASGDTEHVNAADQGLTERVETTTTPTASRPPTIAESRVSEPEQTAAGESEPEPVDPEAIEQLSAADLGEFVETNLEMVFRGDVGAGHRVQKVREACQFFHVPSNAGDEPNLVDWAANIHRRQEPRFRAVRKAWRDSPSPEVAAWNMLGSQRSTLPGTPVTPSSSEQETVTRLSQWTEACSKTLRWYTPSLRLRLESLARAGNPAARYLYATWRPSGDERANEPDEFLAFQAWERNARDFTRLNREAGEPAGLMAYALSYRDGLFTGRDPRVAIPLYLAALDCGFPAPDLQIWLEQIVEELDGQSAELFLPLLQEADRLKRRCRR